MNPIKTGTSDSGEPYGSAGRPMLRVLVRAEVGDVIVVSVRYFGGTKLGIGRLTRAYSQVTSLALKAVSLGRANIRRFLYISVPYAYERLFLYLSRKFDVVIKETEYDDKARFKIELDKNDCDDFVKLLRNKTCGEVFIRK